MRSIALFVALLAAMPAPAPAAGPADGLLRLVPADAAATLVVEGLRENSRAIATSPLAEDLLHLPAVRAWLDSPERRRLDSARGEVERALGVGLATIRDEVLGDAVVLALVVPPGKGADEARGLLLARVRDRAVLDRMIAGLNDAERRDGSLAGVASRRRGGAAYAVRQFRAGTKPDEAYAILDGPVLAWSNSEALLAAVIDRKAGSGPGLGDDRRFRRVRAGLPTDAVAALYLDPRALDAAGRRPGAEDAAGAVARAAWGAVEYVGAALEWRDGPILHVRQAIEPNRLDPALRKWAEGPPDRAVALARRAPRSTLALAAGHVDLEAAAGAVLGRVPEADRPRFDLAMTALRGLLLGRDPRREILPHLGPGLVAYVAPSRGASPSTSPRLATVLALELGGGRAVAEAVDNALRTLLALAAMDPKAGAGRRELGRVDRSGAKITTLSLLGREVAYSVGDGLLVLGTSADAVAEFASGSGRTGSDTAFDRLRADYFPRASSFAFADLPGLADLAASRREDLARRLAAGRGGSAAEARRDLDRAIALMRAFRGAFATAAIEPGFTAVHASFGLVGRPGQAGEAPP